MMTPKFADVVEYVRTGEDDPEMKALLEQRHGRIAPDANMTIRFTSGLIEGYSPRDAVVYLPQTTLTGLIEKDTG